MPKFLKIQISSESGNIQGSEWRLIIDNVEDVLKYSEIDNILNMEAYLHVNRETHPRGRGANILQILDVKFNSLPEGEKAYPLIELANIFDRKTMGMIRSIQNGKELCINPAGGYCFLDGFLDTWNGKIIETVIKKDFGFPIETEIINAEYLVLENDYNYIACNITEYLRSENINNYKAILRLRETDLTYVFKAVQNAKTILIHSEFNNVEQINQFLQLFSKIEGKNFVLSSYNNGIERLKNNPLYNTCAEKNNITFIEK